MQILINHISKQQLTLFKYQIQSLSLKDELWLIYMVCICLQLKEQANDSISVLEGALHLKKDFYVHTLRTLDLLAADTAANGETESSTAGLCITADELHCQVGGPHSRYQSTDFSFFKRTCTVMGCSLFFFGFRFIMTWEVFSSTGAAQTRQPIEKPVITSDRPKIC